MMHTMLAFAANVGAAQAGVHRHALVVGVNKPSGELMALRYAQQDASRFSGVLAELGGFEADSITTLADPDPREILAAIEHHGAISAAEPDDLFVFYYSGHADGLGLRLGEERLTYDELRRAVEAMDAEVRLGILDACQSGGITRTKGMSIAAPFADAEALSTAGDAWLTAASADEAAQESERLRGSFFTHYLVSGLRGAADRGDGRVSLDEAYAYAYDRTVARTGSTSAGVQHPGYDFRLQGNGDLPLTEVMRADARVTFAEELAGVVTVIQLPDETPVAEVSKRAGEPSTLGLPAGSYVLRLRDGDSVETARIGLESGAQLEVRDFRPAPEELALAKGPEAPSRPSPRHPHVAGLASTLIPGAGQAYNDQWFKGGMFLVGSITTAGSIFGYDNVRVDSTGVPGMATVVGPLVWGWSIADAVHHAGNGRLVRPRQGMSLGYAAGLDTAGLQSRTLSADWMLDDTFSLGIDESGAVWRPNGDITWVTGVRGSLALGQSDRWRPALLAGVGAASDQSTWDPVVSVGGELRYYPTPRFFMVGRARGVVSGQGQLPAELVGGTSLGMGIHLGR